MLRPGLLTTMRRRQARLQPGVGRLMQRASTGDAHGGRTATFTDVGVLAARIGPPTAAQLAEATVGNLPDHVITTAWDTPARPGDHIVVGGRTFEVLDDASDRTWTTAAQLPCREIR